MLKIDIKRVDTVPEEIFQLDLQDDLPTRGRSVNQRLLVTRAGLKALNKAASTALEAPEKGALVREHDIREGKVK